MALTSQFWEDDQNNGRRWRFGGRIIFRYPLNFTRSLNNTNDEAIQRIMKQSNRIASYR
jgi:hypothetical protein